MAPFPEHFFCLPFTSAFPGIAFVANLNSCQELGDVRRVWDEGIADPTGLPPFFFAPWHSSLGNFRSLRKDALFGENFQLRVYTCRPLLLSPSALEVSTSFTRNIPASHLCVFLVSWSFPYGPFLPGQAPFLRQLLLQGWTP